MKKLLMLTGALLALQAIPAMAQDEGAPPPPAGEKMMHKGENRGEKMFEQKDTNKDGVISESEFMDGAKKRFSEVDGDHDGKITKDEAKTHHESMRAKWKEKREAFKKAKETGDAPVEKPTE